jgi:hypothetical protein
LQIIHKNKQISSKFLLFGFIVAFVSVALYLIPSTLHSLNVYSTISPNSGASQFAPGNLQKQYPTDPVNPGASQFAPGNLQKQYPTDPVNPGASQFAPGHFFKD